MWLTPPSPLVPRARSLGDALTVPTRRTGPVRGQPTLTFWLTCTRPAFPYLEQQDDDRGQMREISGQPEDIHGRRETDGLARNSPVPSSDRSTPNTGRFVRVPSRSCCKTGRAGSTRVENMAKVQVDVEGGVKETRGRASIGPESDPRRGSTRLRGAELTGGRDAPKLCVITVYRCRCVSQKQ